MARMTKAELLMPFGTYAQGRWAEQWCFEVPGGVVSLATAEFSGAGYDLPACRVEEIIDIAEQFGATRSLQGYSAEPGRERQLLVALATGSNVHTVLKAMAPEFVSELANCLHEADANWVLDPVREPKETIHRVRRAANALARSYKPKAGPRADLSLELAVRDLIAVVEPIIGHFPKVRGNKNNGHCGPTPGCSGSQFIEQLLKGVDPSLYPPAVMNMIEKVRRQPEKTEDPLMELVWANPINALDLSLLRGKEEAIARMRDDPINGFA
jgi:hypothetical protein